MKTLMRYMIPLVLSLVCSSGLSWSADDVAGTNWRITEDNGHITTYTFNPDGSCTYYQEVSPSGNQGKTYSNCKWAQNDGVLAFNANRHFASRIALIEGEAMHGYYVTNWKNNHGSFKGERIK